MSVLALPRTQKVTYQDYLRFDDETRYELLEGELEMPPAPEIDHQDTSMELSVLIYNTVKKENAGKVFSAPIDVVLNDDNVVQPDIVFVSKDNAGILQKQAVIGAPDLVVEILSPSSVYKDRHTKKALYERFGVLEYWIVDPGNHAIEVFSLENDRFELFSIASGTGVVTSKVLRGFRVDVEQLF